MCFFSASTASSYPLPEWAFNSPVWIIKFLFEVMARCVWREVDGLYGWTWPPLLSCSRSGWREEVLECSGADRVVRSRAQVGPAGRSALYAQEESRRGCRIWAITLFVFQGSYLFAGSDMFLSSGSAVQYGKPIALKCIYLSCRRSRQTEQAQTGNWKVWV